MDKSEPFEIFLVVTPGLEQPLAEEARALGFDAPVVSPGGVTMQGHWTDIWRANLWLRGATRVLVRIGAFRAFHLAQLDKRARKFPWADTLRADVPLRVEVTCRKSKIYHAKAAAQRIERALSEVLGATIDPKADLVVKVRIEDDLCAISLDTSGESLHKRGHKPAVGKAPMRETMAAMFLCQCGFDGHETVYDPMCGSGTFVLEAAEIATGLAAGRSRGFAFQHLASFDAEAWDRMRNTASTRTPDARFFGSDRNDGAIANSIRNSEAAGVGAITRFHRAAISDIAPPEGPPGLVIVNPPYGARIGNKKVLFGLYGAFGQVLKDRFQGWRVGVITSDGGLARATALPFLPPGPPVAHGGLKVKLYQTAPLP
ncbi:class I SAM-dependent RNA methyltransferase [Ruegeria sp. 2205SS24-7]|uniref:THUMP domain-containing class I SAM-dependent RNA methyltransferase n=1 Tax=Ruegeria discodermiae TaxID=3064389 RepID=UPI0027423DDF|nr:class I SAM-dependent RNA methyltransferase [Ruegeria sp. 2205SS24-7]MDP5215782.1 class I SAM-dependent RNA methyltransferase [Ruegeria sp. 2205SS24-7]